MIVQQKKFDFKTVDIDIYHKLYCLTQKKKSPLRLPQCIHPNSPDGEQTQILGRHSTYKLLYHGS
jgi:hypothetical protein